jgi:hypothetical protein
MVNGVLPLIRPLRGKILSISLWLEAQKNKLNFVTRIAMVSLYGALQGSALGCVAHMVIKKRAAFKMAKMTPEQKAQMAKISEKTLPETIRPSVTLFAVQNGLTEACNHFRGNKDDAWQLCVSPCCSDHHILLAFGCC